jgi:hypothetical protein
MLWAAAVATTCSTDAAVAVLAQQITSKKAVFQQLKGYTSTK